MPLDVKFFHPFGFIGLSRPKTDTPENPADDLRCYGFSLDLTTECYFYTYDWGFGFNLRVFGFGFELNWYKFS